jgi:hypothetical protein
VLKLQKVLEAHLKYATHKAFSDNFEELEKLHSIKEKLTKDYYMSFPNNLENKY